jgi:hypothetical protein
MRKIPLKIKGLVIPLILLLSWKGFTQKTVDEEKKYQSRKNIVKMSLTSLAFRNYNFQAERVLNKTFSLALSYSFIPEGGIPFKDQIIDQIDEEDEETINVFETASLSYRSFTPEIRIYLGEGYGKGFYLAPFYRNAKYDISEADFYEFERDNGDFETLTINGNSTSNSFGLLIGWQFNLGQRIILDWWILGPHWGTSKGDFSGIPDTPLSPSEQLLLASDLEDIIVPGTDLTFEISSTEVKMDTKGNWGGIRAGLTLGVRF